MADPVSIVSLTIQVVGIAKRLGELIKIIHDAPEELLALSNEVNDLSIVVGCFREALPDEEDDLSHIPLSRAKSDLDGINLMLQRWGRVSAAGDSWHIGRFDKFLWLRERKKVNQYQQRIRETRANLSAMVGAKALSKTARVAVEVHTLFELSASHNQASQRGIAAAIGHSISTSVDAALENPPAYIDLEQHYELPLSLARPAQKSGSTDIISPGTAGPSPVAVGVTRYPPSQRCDPDCPCLCHKKLFVRSPKILEQFIGRLFLGYTCLPFLKQPCTSVTCHQRSSNNASITYFLPRWFSEKAVSATFMSSPMGSPSLNLKIRRVVPEVSQLFRLSRYGDAQGLRDLFISGRASPDDVHIRGGWTALHFAVDHGRIEACKFLLDSGADPEWESATGNTPVDMAWSNILQLNVPAKAAEVLAILFPGTDFIQSRIFSRLHRIILGLEVGDLDKELASGRSHVDVRDIDGWTPLHWAARRGDHAALCTLMAHGADAFLSTESVGLTSLHLAALSNSVTCVQTLLQHRRGNRVLDLEVQDYYGSGPLRVTSAHNCAAAAACLMRHGADMNQEDRVGETPLLSAVYNNSHEIITLLLKAGADFTRATTWGNGILHFAANESDAETLALLTKARMRGLDVEARNSDGFTATELAEARDNPPDGFIEAWGRLVASIAEEDLDESWHSPTPSTDKSFHSFEDLVWYEAELGAEVDIAEAGL
ncbi:hypothetical protein MPH_05147 [Macrophomina phaseolina MS6]|uniref:Uncharacterized protein n=1 Tax=Macrophomina phaseolina (strain MS6) TaxID=1126212 RepID=K2RSK3_MACPH|nr:hypothetical protein MPH_05147 [Macrophomina phaseolina MS6]